MLAAVFISFAHVNDGCFACVRKARGIVGSDIGGARSRAGDWSDGTGRHRVYESRQELMVPGNVGVATLEVGTDGNIRERETS